MRRIGMFLIGLALMLIGDLAIAAPPQAVLAWTAPVSNTDGSAIAGAVTYNIYQGLTGSLVRVQSAVTASSVTITTGLTPGTSQCFAVTAVVGGIEGAQSNAACKAIPFPIPNAPTNLTVN